MLQTYSLKHLAEISQSRVVGDEDYQIATLAPIDKANPNELAFLSNKAYKKFLPTTQAGAILLTDDMLQDCKTNALVHENPYLAYAKISEVFAKQLKVSPGISKSAVVGKNTKVSDSATIGANVVIGHNCKIAANVVIKPNCVIGNNCEIMAGSILNANVTLYNDISIGRNCIIHAGVVIGADGFGYAEDRRGKWHKIAHLGGVRIGDDVEIGASTTIDRGALADTVIGDGVKIDNQVQVAHNVIIGEHTAIAGCVAIAGSCKIGKLCRIGGSANLGGHIEIADRTYISGDATVIKSITKPGAYSSLIPAQEHKIWWRNVAKLHRLAELIKDIKK